MASSVFWEIKNKNKNLPASSVFQKSGLRNNCLFLFSLKNIIFTTFKNRCVLHRHVWVMIPYLIHLFLSDADHLPSVMRYFCRFCSKPCKGPSGVAEHERIHTGEKPYSCEICGKSFTTKSNMKAHQIVHLKR